MAVGAITVTVYCDGDYHQAEQLRFSERVLKSDITAKLRTMGWRTSAGGKTFCPRHPAPRGRS